MTTEHVYSDIYNYDLPVFKLTQKDGYSKVILDKLTIPNNFMNINYNCNCLRWLRNVVINSNLNPYFTSNAPDNEFHLCSLYLSPGNYKTREEIIAEINRQLRNAANCLFSNANVVRNLYIEYRYTGAVTRPFSISNALADELVCRYPEINRSGKYNVLINALNNYGRSYNFKRPYTLITYRDHDLFNSLELALNGYASHITIDDIPIFRELSDFTDKLINGQQGNFQVLIDALLAYKEELYNDIPALYDEQYPKKKNIYDTYCTILDSYRLNSTNYGNEDGLFEIYNGINDSNMITNGIDKSILNYVDDKGINRDFDALTRITHNGVTGVQETDMDIIIGSGEDKNRITDIYFDIKPDSLTEIRKFNLLRTWHSLGYALINLIYNFIVAYRESILTSTKFPYTKTDIINACIALNIYEIDDPFIDNVCNLIENDESIFKFDNINDKIRLLAGMWLDRLLNQFLVHILFGRAQAGMNVEDKTVAYNNYDHLHGIDAVQTNVQNDSVDWFTEQVISVLDPIANVYSEFDTIPNDDGIFKDYFNFLQDLGKRDEVEYVDTIDMGTKPLHYILTRTNGTKITNLADSLRLALQYLTQEMDGTDSDLLKMHLYAGLLEANLTEGATVSYVQYNVYKSDGKLREIGIEFKSEDIDGLNTIIADNKDDIRINGNGVYSIGDITMSRKATNKTYNLDVINGKLVGTLYKLTNTGVNQIEIQHNKYLYPGEYIQLAYDQSGLKFEATFGDDNDKYLTNSTLTDKMDFIQALNRETVYIEADNDTIVQVRNTDALLNDPYFQTLNDDSISPFEINDGIISNIGNLIFIESNEDVLPYVNDFTKIEYKQSIDRYVYVPDLYVYDSDAKTIEINESTYKISQFAYLNARIPNSNFKHRENDINIASRIGLPCWKTDITSNDKPFIKTYNYTEIPFNGSLTSAYNMYTADYKINLRGGTTVSSSLTSYIFNAFSTSTINFTSSLSLLLPPVIYTCAVTNKDIENVISRSDTSNQVHSYEPDYGDISPQITIKFSNEIKLTIPDNDTVYVYLTASELPYSIPNGLARLDYTYVK